jgi:hypothetical protein
MQQINFGRIEDLHIVNGEPLLAPQPRILREIKFGRENGPRPEAAKADFELKAEVVEMFAHMKTLGNGVVARLEIQHGLPFRMTF